jgi:predicted AAA+ superfamily ATPase
VIMTPTYERNLVSVLAARMRESRRFIQVMAGPRQTGKSTAVTQALAHLSLPQHFVTADRIATRSPEWLEAEWQQARLLTNGRTQAAILAVDEVQNVSQWSSTVKALWDEDARSGIDLRVVLSGSSSLLLQKGLSESLMGRFEMIRSTHWSFAEMHAAFGYELDEYLLYGGYPASALFKDDFQRWLWYMNDAVVEATISRDIVQMEEVRKPALLRNLFMLGCQYSSQELSYRNIQGQLQDRGNVTTIAHYLELLSNADLLCALMKYDEKPLNTRRSSPRLAVFDTSLMSSVQRDDARLLLSDPERRGRLYESAVGAYLLAQSKRELFDVLWWREGNSEVDFVLKKGAELLAIEVKSGRVKGLGGLQDFRSRYPKAELLVVGGENHPLEEFLSTPLPWPLS